MDDPSRHDLVSSLYGPGSVGAWLLTALAVVLSWTLNPHLRGNDVLTLDFITMLAFPAIAAIDGMCQLLRFQGGPQELLTRLDTETLKYSSAFEAPVTVCKTYFWIFLGLSTLSSVRRCKKRLISLLIAGSFGYSVQATLNITLGREFPKNNFVRPHMISAGTQTTFTMLSLCLISLGWIYFQFRYRDQALTR
jgi:hypothetical protein